MKFDHVVVHVEQVQSSLATLRQQATQLGFPVENVTSELSRAFRVGNVWVGEPDFELPRQISRHGSSSAVNWTRSWIERANRATRGNVSLFLRHHDLERLQSELAVRGIQSSIENTSYKSFFGLNRVTLPWRYLRLPPIVGTDLEIGFVDCEESFAAKLLPNSKLEGATGLLVPSDVDFLLPEFGESMAFLKAVFPKLEPDPAGAHLALQNCEFHFHQAPSSAARVILDFETSIDRLRGKSCSFQNVVLRTGHAEQA